MDALSSILAIVLSIGLTQGFVVGYVLWRRDRDIVLANRLKALLLFALSYGLLNQVLRLFGIGYYDVWYHITLDLSWSYGPLIYLYVKANSTQNFRFDRSSYWIISPIVLQVIISIFVRSQNFFWNGTRESLTWLGYYGYAYWRNFSTEPIIASILIIYFCARSLRLLSHLPANVVNEDNLRWVSLSVKLFAGYYSLVLAILTVDLLVYVSTVSTDYFYFYPFFIGTAFLVYWFGITSVTRPGDQLIKTRRQLDPTEKRQLEEIAEKVKIAMEQDKVYRDSELTVGKLSEQISVKSYLISRSLSEIACVSFNEYVNEYRVKEIQKLLADPENQKYTLLALAYEAGFNSKSSFNRAVKKHLGVAPSEILTLKS